MRTIADANNPLALEITKIIQKKGLKQVFIAQKAGYTKQELNDMLNGRKLIKVCDIPRLAYALGVEVNELFKNVNMK